MSLNKYRFRSVWTVQAPMATVFAVLDDLGHYPAWWPEVRAIRKVDERCAELVCRSKLPYELVFRASHDRRDEQAGVLRARLTGDLDGYCSWVITGANGGSVLEFRQEVVVTRRLLRVLAPVARFALLANHELMMRSGQRGLRGYLAERR